MSIDDVIEIGADSRYGGANSVGLVETQSWTCTAPLDLECGQSLSPFTQAYETYGELNAARDNAILVLHALSGDAHVAGYHAPDDTKPGWWDLLIGPGKVLDTRKYFVVCPNVLGGCKGSSGPASVNPRTGRPYALDFPLVTIGDMVRAQARLMDHLGIRRWLGVMGGSMGGMQALEWAARYPERVASVLAIATSARLSAQGIAFDEVGRRAIMADPNFCNGDYYGKEPPKAGLAIARMIGHITYLSDEQMHAKFGRRLQDRQAFGYGFSPEFEVESYLQYQGNSFIRRFDANSYLYITKAIDYYDLAAGHPSLAAAVAGMQSEFLVISFQSDWLYPTYQSKELVQALLTAGVRASFLEIPSTYGHDAFLLPNPKLGQAIAGFAASVLRRERQSRRAEFASSDANGPPRDDRSASEDAPLRVPPLRVADAPAARAAEFASSDANSPRRDLQVIEALVPSGARVLDLGCGDGELLARLAEQKGCQVHGIEIDERAVRGCIQWGVPVYHGDMLEGMGFFPDQAFDLVILSQTLQQVLHPARVIGEMLRVGRRAIVSFPNFGYWRTRLSLALGGAAPARYGLASDAAGQTPNVHLCTLRDFHSLCAQGQVRMEREILLTPGGQRIGGWLAGWRADVAVYVLVRCQ